MSDAFTFVAWRDEPSAPGWAEVAALWNRAARGRHAFYPWWGEELAVRVGGSPRFEPGLAWWALADGRPVGFAHGSRVLNVSFEPCAAVELLLVAPEWRRRGVGGGLLDALVKALAERTNRPAGKRRPAPRLTEWLSGRRHDGPLFVDALGAWPCGPLYATLADGSERSGVFYEAEPALAACFASRGFLPHRDSVVLRRGLTPDDQAAATAAFAGDIRVSMAPREAEGDYLDETFRGWRLWDHCLAGLDGGIYSRSIFARMDGVSEHEGVEHYAVFGVNTTPGHRRAGWAKRNFRLMFGELFRRGGRSVELHCYADNEPALGLYRSLGFELTARTRAMRRPL